MTDIQSNEEQAIQHQYAVPSGRRSFLIRLVLSTGLVSTDKMAEYVLLGIAAIALASMFLIPSLFGSGTHPLTNQDIVHITQLQQGIPAQ